MMKNIRFYNLQEQANEFGLALRKSYRGNYYELIDNFNEKMLRFKTLGEVEDFLEKHFSRERGDSYE